MQGLLGKLANNRDPGSVASRMRRRRFQTFIELASALARPVRVLDVGGTFGFWEAMFDTAHRSFEITVMNLEASAPSRGLDPTPGRTFAVGDARAIPFADRTFDVVFSNSVIEHVGTLDDQRRAASEMQRVGRRWFVQTPNRRFPLEPHFLVPFFQFLPLDLRAFLLSRSRLGWMERVPDRAEARRVVESVRLLERAELKEMFPTSSIVDERVLGLTKSFTAIGGWDLDVTERAASKGR